MYGSVFQVSLYCDCLICCVVLCFLGTFLLWCLDWDYIVSVPGLFINFMIMHN